MNPYEHTALFIKERNWDSLYAQLRMMSNMQFRRTVTVLRENLLPAIDDNDLFWDALAHIITYKSQAMLTCIVAAEHLAKSGTLNFDTEGCRLLQRHLAETNPDGLTKMAKMLFPLLKTEKQTEDMFDRFGIDRAEQRIAILLTANSPLSYFMIFKTPKASENGLLTRKCCSSIIKRQDDMAYNAASIFKAYFGIEDLPAQFSLKIEQYELSHIDRDYSTFLRMLNGKRPTI